ncbi:hypothetical protein IU449_26810 [Nocardia higoensis]|uniref:Uncharacterized protein n=1 Tax=Nocardia higoensis TaxID=228599 RepID=A0ABS0DI29_9NOCA|nr:hypothetical protein [Nocardia higoensis]MBF6358111.1 hypothetical protein [Nocardia higoensis]
MSYDYGPLDTYEIIWASGHIEHIDAHQVLLPPADMLGAFLPGATATRTRNGWTFHGEVEGRWKLLLFAPAEDIVSVRNLTHTRDRAEQAGEPDAA